MKRIISIVVLLLALASCSKKDDPTPPVEPMTPGLSPSSVSVEEGKSVEVTISGGRPPYTATVTPREIISLSLTGDKLSVTGIKVGNATVTIEVVDGGKATLPVTVTTPVAPDPYAAFKSDATLRWETSDGEVLKGDDPAFTVITDRGTLLASEQSKCIYASNDGTSFRSIEWGSAPILRTENGTIPVTSFDIVKENGKIWMVFSDGNLEHWVVAEKP